MDIAVPKSKDMDVPRTVDTKGLLSPVLTLYYVNVLIMMGLSHFACYHVNLNNILRFDGAELQLRFLLLDHIHKLNVDPEIVSIRSVFKLNALLLQIQVERSPVVLSSNHVIY